MKKRIDIEKLLKWAYCEELPKGGDGRDGPGTGSAWSSIESFMQLLAKVDENEYGVVPTLSPLDGDPHDDALKVHAAVCELGDQVHEFPACWNPMPEIAKHGHHAEHVLDAARFGIKSARRNAVDIVRKHAILGGCPDWQGDVPELKPVLNAHGEPIWFILRVVETVDRAGNPVEYKHESEDGWNRNTKAPKRGAYQKFFFDPDPTGTIIARGEYQIWRAGLACIAQKLSGSLEKWEIAPFNRAVEPWTDGDYLDGQREPTILHDLKFST